MIELARPPELEFKKKSDVEPTDFYHVIVRSLRKGQKVIGRFRHRHGNPTIILYVGNPASKSFPLYLRHSKDGITVRIAYPEDGIEKEFYQQWFIETLKMPNKNGLVYCLMTKKHD